MLNLDSVTIVSINTRDPEQSVKAIEYSTQYIKFAKQLLISNTQHPDIETAIIPDITSLQSYNHFCIKELHKYIDTDHCLVVQPDGFVVNPLMWIDSFLNYDYIGAPWNKMLSQRALTLYSNYNYEYFTDINNVPIIVGNGGFSLRSKKLLNTLKDITDYNYNIPEDVFISATKREFLKEQGIKYAPVSIARRFSLEHPIDNDEKNAILDGHFGFHGTHDFKVSLLNLLKTFEDVEPIKNCRKISL
jgi:hypothetical protein